MYVHTIFFAVLRQQRKSADMTSLGHSTRSVVYYKAGSPFYCAWCIVMTWLQIVVSCEEPYHFQLTILFGRTLLVVANQTMSSSVKDYKCMWR
jgi:hypothetical protein